MTKSSGSSRYVRDAQFNGCIGYGNAYSLDGDQNRGKQTVGSEDGVQLLNISCKNWKGTCADSAARGPINFNCAMKLPCTKMNVSGFAVWTMLGARSSIRTPMRMDLVSVRKQEVVVGMRRLQRRLGVRLLALVHLRCQTILGALWGL